MIPWLVLAGLEMDRLHKHFQKKSSSEIYQSIKDGDPDFIPKLEAAHAVSRKEIKKFNLEHPKEARAFAKNFKADIDLFAADLARIKSAQISSQ